MQETQKYLKQHPILLLDNTFTEASSVSDSQHFALSQSNLLATSQFNNESYNIVSKYYIIILVS